MTSKGPFQPKAFYDSVRDYLPTVPFHKIKVCKETSTCLPQIFSLSSSCAVSQDPLQLCVSKWRRGGFLKAEIPLSVIITGNNSTEFIVIPFCKWESCDVCCIHSANCVYLDCS